MAYVITEKCLAERYGDCVEVCPVDCIHPGAYKGEVFMIIDPKVENRRTNVFFNAFFSHIILIIFTLFFLKIFVKYPK